MGRGQNPDSWTRTAWLVPPACATLIRSAWLTRAALHLQSYSKTLDRIPHNDVPTRAAFEEDPSPTMNTADRTLSDKGFKRVTPWVFGPAFSDGLRADIIKL
jgi:hypothetical protein